MTHFAIVKVVFQKSTAMTYPQAPWQLQGYALQTLNLIDIAHSRPLIPAELEIFSVLPGKTLGGVYLCYYGSGSVLSYHELIIASGLVRYQGVVGGWISHIYVDNPASVAGGREIWGLPKQLADFSWQEKKVTVTQQDKELCTLTYERPWFYSWQQTIKGNVFSTLNGDLISFEGIFNTKGGLAKGSLNIPAESPFASLNLSKPWLIFSLKPMELVAQPPLLVKSGFLHMTENS